VIEGFIGSDSFQMVLFEHALEKVESVRVKSFVFGALARNIAGSVLGKHLIVSFSWEGALS
jgi:hypothetical protein